MSYWKLRKHLEYSISGIDVLNSKTLNDKSMVQYLQNHFRKYEGSAIIEYEKENNLINWLFCNWSVSQRSPLKYKSVENPEEGLVCLSSASAFDDCNGFKYLCNPAELASIDDIFYVELAKEVYGDFVQVYQQNIYAPLKKVKKLMDS
ncbi:MAG: hypothetical protein ACOCQG_05740 [Candidatus Nanoarchaeia archaeon]